MSAMMTPLMKQLPLAGLIDHDILEESRTLASAENKTVIAYLVEQQKVESHALALFCEQHYQLPLFNLDKQVLNEISEDFLHHQLIEKYHVLPLYQQHSTLYIAMSDPSNLAALEAFSFCLNLHTDVLLVEESQLRQAIDSLMSDGINVLTNMDDIENVEIDDVQSRLDDTQVEDDDAPIVKYINSILLDAVKKGASDLHFEPYEFSYRIRFRVDGILYEVASPPVNLANRFSARLKVMAKLDIAERRLPQDGRIKLKISNQRNVDLRVSTLPTMWGEKVVMRLLDASTATLDIHQLGYDEQQKSLYLQALAKPQGLILITGPTGSGKTVSLYTGLNILNTVERNISTAEDPVEINLTGINQVQINAKSGLTFASALRSFLRQDPDVVMVGEVRDLETAEIAIKAAQTGHLVLSTLHTNSAADTVMRLLNMGVPAFNVAASVSLIIAQRLARCLCPVCKAPLTISDEELIALGFTAQQLLQKDKLFKPVGCEQCHDGYKGRVGLYEMMAMSEQLETVILQSGSATQIANVAIQEGMTTLRQSGIQQALKGVISLNEITRVTAYLKRNDG